MVWVEYGCPIRQLPRDQIYEFSNRDYRLPV